MRFDFLVCSERSGSNLATRIMNNHSKICAPPTLHCFRLLCTSAATYEPLSDDRNWSALLGDLSALMQAQLGEWRRTWTDADLAGCVAVRSLDSLLRHVFQAEAAARGKQRLFVKEIEMFDYFTFVAKHFSDAKFVYMTRDPRDMALSWKKSAAIRGGVVRAAKIWIRDQRHYLSLSRDPRYRSRFIHLTYEALVADPDNVIRKACEFLGVGYERTMLDFHASPETIALARSALDFANLQRPLIAHNSGKFRTELTADEIAYVDAICGPLMHEFGYELEASSLGELGLSQLEQQLVSLEPVEKQAYLAASEHERRQRAAWVAAKHRILARQVTQGTISNQAVRGDVV